MRLKFILILFSFLLGGMSLKAQDQTDSVCVRDSLDFIIRLQQDTVYAGQIHLFQDERLNKLLQTDLKINLSKPGFTGYRIQIFSGRSVEKEKAIAVKEHFEELFPEVRVYVVYQAPVFRVRVGNFRTKMESIPLYQKIKREFPNCYPVKTEILFEDLKPLPLEEQDDVDTVQE